MSRVFVDAPVERESGSELALTPRLLGDGETRAFSHEGHDTVLFVAAGSGVLSIGGQHHQLAERAAALIVSGETADVAAGEAGLHLIQATIGPYVDRHAPIGPRDVVVSAEEVAPGSATGKRSFQILFGPHNGSTRATLFLGYIPPGRAPWHYHLYDEIVWVPNGPGRLHLEGGAEELGRGAAFRLHPREVHVVENTGGGDMAVLGLFTPAGSPSAAYLPAGSEAAYGFASR